MTTTTTAPSAAPIATPPKAKPRTPDFARRVQLARRILQLLLMALLIVGVLSSALGYQSVQTTLGNYRQIVEAGSRSADAAQDAREALLGYHSAAADFLTLSDAGQRAERQVQANAAWGRYQEAIRRSWRNLSDGVFGEYAVFDAADRASWLYNAQVNAMFAFADSGDNARAAASFQQANQTLVQRLIPALDGMERVKIESMESAYARTDSEIRGWVWIFGLSAGVAVLGLLIAFGLTRFWLHYRWTWQLLLASLAGLALFVWFVFSLLNAANQVKIMVRDAYDTVSGVQSVKSLATQADALESIAIFDPANAPATLRDYDEYFTLIERQLCGDRDCWQSSFLADSPNDDTELSRVRPDVVALAQAGQSKYGLPRTPLIANVHFTGEAATLENLRKGLVEYREANQALRNALGAGNIAGAATINRGSSAQSLKALLDAANEERKVARDQFELIWNAVRSQMQINLVLSFLFTFIAALGAWGIAQRRQSLFA